MFVDHPSYKRLGLYGDAFGPFQDNQVGSLDRPMSIAHVTDLASFLSLSGWHRHERYLVVGAVAVCPAVPCGFRSAPAAAGARHPVRHRHGLHCK